MSNKWKLGVAKFDPRDATRNRGHEYGEGRPIKVHKHKTGRRQRDKLRKELDY